MKDKNTLLLKHNLVKTFASLLGCIIFTGIGIFLIIDNQKMGWFVACFFGLCALVFIIELFPNSSYLFITPEGFTVRSRYRSSFTKWSDVQSFEVASIYGRTKAVTYNFSGSYKKIQTGKSFAKVLGGYEAVLPDTYGMKAKDLADLLNKKRVSDESAK